MQKKLNNIKLLAAFTALASSTIPFNGLAQPKYHQKNLPAIELNFDVLEKLKYSSTEVTQTPLEPKPTAKEQIETPPTVIENPAIESPVIENTAKFNAPTTEEPTAQPANEESPEKSPIIIRKAPEFQELPASAPLPVPTENNDQPKRNIFSDIGNFFSNMVSSKPENESDASKETAPAVVAPPPAIDDNIEENIQPVQPASKPKKSVKKTAAKKTEKPKKKHPTKSAKTKEVNAATGKITPNSTQESALKTVNPETKIQELAPKKDTAVQNEIVEEKISQPENISSNIAEQNEPPKAKDIRRVQEQAESKPEEKLIVKEPTKVVPAEAVITTKQESTNVIDVSTAKPATLDIDQPDKKNEKTMFSALMDNLPEFSNKAKEVKPEQTTATKPNAPILQDPVVVNSALEAKMAESKKIITEKTKPVQKNNTKEIVAIDKSAEQKLGDTIDRSISSTNITTPPIPEPAKIPVAIAELIPPPDSAALTVQEVIEPVKPDAIKTSQSQAASANKEILLSLAFENNSVTINAVDADRLNKFVKQILHSGKRLKVMSYASGATGEVNSSRRISLQRAIAIRNLMIQAGLEKERINVQAIGNNPGDQEFANSANIYLVE